MLRVPGTALARSPAVPVAAIARLLSGSGAGLAFSFSSGGSRTAWMVGLLAGLFGKQPALLGRVRVSCGSSGGALAAAALAHAVVEGDPWPLRQACEAFRTICRHGFSRPMLEDVIEQCMPDDVIERINARGLDPERPVELGACAVSTGDLKARLFATTGQPRPWMMRRALVASAAMPGYVSPVEVIPGQPPFLDGAFADFNPSGFLGWFRCLDLVSLVVRLDVARPGACEITHGLRLLTEAPSIGTRAVGMAAHRAARHFLGLDLDPMSVTGVMGRLGALLLPPGSQEQAIARSLARQAERHSLDLPVIRLLPGTDPGFAANEFDEDRVLEVIDAGQRLGERFGEAMRPPDRLPEPAGRRVRREPVK